MKEHGLCPVKESDAAGVREKWGHCWVGEGKKHMK